MNVTCTFHSPEGATVVFGLVFLGNRTVCRQTHSQVKIGSHDPDGVVNICAYRKISTISRTRR